MKKITLLCLLIMFVMTSSAFAAAWVTTEGQTLYASASSTAPTDAAAATSIGKLSSNVIAGGFCDATDGAGYSISTRHTQGSQSYGSAHDSTSIWMVKSDSLAAMSETGTGDFFGSWTEL
jgi:hypothetical protein